MHGMFKANGGCGYVKKPDFLLNSNEVFDPEVNKSVKTILKVNVLLPWDLNSLFIFFLKFFFVILSDAFFPFFFYNYSQSIIMISCSTFVKVTVYIGEGWYYDFRHTHFDTYSPPDFYAKVS